MLAGPIIGGATLTRFFSLHVFIIPGMILALVGLHLRLVLTKGINEYPTARPPGGEGNLRPGVRRADP